METERGFIYLIHFESPFKHAKHYLGWARDIRERLARHMSNAPKRRGSALMCAVVKAGIRFKVVRVWAQKTRDEERLMHASGKSWRCPVCCGRVKFDDVKEEFGDEPA